MIVSSKTSETSLTVSKSLSFSVLESVWELASKATDAVSVVSRFTKFSGASLLALAKDVSCNSL